MYSYEQFATDITFWRQVRGDAKRTVICESERIDEIRQAIKAEGLHDVLIVKSSPACPEGKLLLIDEGAIEASRREMIHGSRTTHGGGGRRNRREPVELVSRLEEGAPRHPAHPPQSARILYQ